MFNCLRKLVAGPKNNEINYLDTALDLTYITEHIIAMAYPASGLEQVYRNPIGVVSEYLNEKHMKGCMIINVSDRRYDESHFNSSVHSFEWPDHQAPCLSTLFEICQTAHKHLTQNQNHVIAIHCNHGKGRTGTAIMCILLYLKMFKTVEEVLLYYNKKRFSKESYVVDQPCQIRYISYFCQALHLASSLPKQLSTVIAYKIARLSQKGLTQNYYIKITSVRQQTILFDRLQIEDQQEKQLNDEQERSKSNLEKSLSLSQIPLLGDILIEIMYQKAFLIMKAARINCCLFMLENKKPSLRFQSHQITLEKCFKSKEFTLDIQLEEFCDCHTSNNETCPCQNQRNIEIEKLKKILSIEQNMKYLASKDKQSFLEIELKFNEVEDQINKN